MDYYVVDESEDEMIGDDSSDEDADEFLESLGCKATHPPENSFEDEMDKELEERVAASTEADDAASYGASSTTENLQTNHRPDCTRSNVEDSSSIKKDSPQEDIFYDPKADDEDEAWVQKQRRNTEFEGKKCQKTDAVLNCPCCMSLLCLDCQRHVKYRTQYRAMFVFNCTLDRTKKLEFKSKSKREKKSKNKTGYYAVKCEVCGTQVGVYDEDEVYHFFNTLSSHS
ncbi:E2F-associated phosphoprotein-like [Brevipalpus obovatus]|uniref:E2F-associated phosphoprotein-like n=1 Tax=Brevipalpus obovatus TaxID=246614 RepID=UPI003D9E9E37